MKPHAKRMPVSVRLVVSFLLLLSLFQLVSLLRTWFETITLDREILLRTIRHGVFSLISLLVAIQLLLRLPLARFSAFVVLVAVPAAKTAHYVLFPLAWQTAGIERIRQAAAAFIFIGMAVLLLKPNAASYLRPDSPHREPESKKSAPSPREQPDNT